MIHLYSLLFHRQHLNHILNNLQHQYFANGKLLLTGEYFVLDGATSIALPCKLGQTLKVLPYQAGTIHWRSYDSARLMWLEAIINTSDWSILHTSNDAAAIRLLQILKAAITLDSKIDLTAGHNVWTRLEFDRSWGLGSSSTLLSLIAQWTQVDPYQLASMTFGGSGYDIACASAEGPISYQIKDNQPIVKAIEWTPPFKDHCCFVHLGEKKDTQEALSMYTSMDISDKASIQNKIADINDRILSTIQINEFCAAIEDHEALISQSLNIEKVKDLRFSDFIGSIKSLGAWGGDFVLAASEQDISRTITYFQTKGYETIVLWDDMLL